MHKLYKTYEDRIRIQNLITQAFLSDLHESIIMGKVTLDEFIQTWESQIAKIEKQALDGDAVCSIN